MVASGISWFEQAFLCGSDELLEPENAKDVPSLEPLVQEEAAQNNNDPPSSKYCQEALARLMIGDFWSDERKVVLYALNLATVLYAKDPNVDAKQASICQSGGHVQILGIMSKWRDNPKIQAKALRFFADTCYQNPPLTGAAIPFGAIPTVQSVLRHYPKYEAIQSAGMAALGHLVRYSEEKRQIACLEVDVSLLVQRMRDYPTVLDVQYHGVTLLTMVAEVDPLVVLQASGLEVLGHAYQQHADTENEQHVIIRIWSKSTINRLLQAENNDNIVQNDGCKPPLAPLFLCDP